MRLPGRSEASQDLSHSLQGTPVLDPRQRLRPSGESVPLSPNGRAPLQPIPNRPARGLSLLQAGMALLMLLGVVGIALYTFRQPLLRLFNGQEPQVTETNEQPEVSAPPAEGKSPAPEKTLSLPPKEATPAKEPGAEIASSTSKAPPPPEKTPDPVKSKPATPPTEIVRAQPVSAAEVAAVRQASGSMSSNQGSSAPEVPNLVEVPSLTGSDAPLLGETSAKASDASDSNQGLGPSSAIPSEDQPFAQALMSFFQASTLEDKLRYILFLEDPEIAALARNYYSMHPPKAVEITRISHIRSDPNPEVGGGRQAVFSVVSPSWNGDIPVMVQDTSSGFKLDWVAFIEFKDHFLHTFSSAYRPTAGHFHVGISRSHYFRSDVPDLENKHCFEVSAPHLPETIPVFVPKDSPIADALTRIITWDTQVVYVIADLQWRREGNAEWIELIGVPQMNWYSKPTHASQANGQLNATE